MIYVWSLLILIAFAGLLCLADNPKNWRGW